MNIVESSLLRHRLHAFFLRTCSSLMLAIFLAAALSACNEGGGNDGSDQTGGDEQIDAGENEDDTINDDPIDDDSIDNDDNEIDPPSVMLFKSSATGGIGNELWISDGTAGGTGVLKDINYAGGDSEPGPFTAVDDTVFFAAKTDADGRELWKTDGTEAGTVVVTNINPCDGCSAGSSSDSVPRNLTPFNGMLYFTATNPELGRELWKTDGSVDGAQLVKDIREGDQGSIGAGTAYLTVSNGALYFTADNGETGRELWKTDGTEAGTLLVKILT